ALRRTGEPRSGDPVARSGCSMGCHRPRRCVNRPRPCSLIAAGAASLRRAYMSSEGNEAPRLVPVMRGDTCVGFLINLGPRGVEAFDKDEKSLGVFSNMISAVTAVEKSGASPDNITRLIAHPEAYKSAEGRERLPNRRAALTFEIKINGLRYTATVGRFADG